MCTDDKKCDENATHEIDVMVAISGNPLLALFDANYGRKLEAIKNLYENAPATTKLLIQAIQASDAGKGDEVQAILKEAASKLNKAGIL